MKIFILDDARSISQALRFYNRKPEDCITLCRPFRWNGEEIVSDLTDAEDTICANPRFDLWVLDNDLGGTLEGYAFLKDMAERYPDKIPQNLVSVSANPARRADITAYHRNWLAAQGRAGDGL